MKVIEVIPIARGIGKDTLTYFTSTSPQVGAVISAELRGKKIRAVVVSSKDATEHRAELREMPFKIKKAGDVGDVKQIFLPEFLEATKETAKYYMGTVGGALHSLVPRFILENTDKILGVENNAEKTEKDLKRPTNKKAQHVLVLQGDDLERVGHYKSIVREEFARGKSVFLCVPTAADAVRTKNQLDRGIEDYSYIFHNQIRKKNLIDSWNGALENTHPVLIISTGSFFCLPRHDIGTILIERESSRGYKFQTRPFVDIRKFAEILAKKTEAKIIYGDTLLRAETIWRYKKDEIQEMVPLAFRSGTRATQTIADARTKNENESAKFYTLSPKLAELIEKTTERSEHTFLFAARRGLSPLTLCLDCGSIVLCKNCQAPIVLHSKSTGRFFLCHHCGEQKSAEERCANCTGWRLRSFGVGIETVAEEIKQKFPRINLFRIDSDTVKTNAKAESIIKEFKEKPGSVLIGTEMAVGYLDIQIENTAIVSIDSMFSIPDFKINEKILATLLKVRGLANKNFIIQTRDPKNKIFEYATQGNLVDFYKEELADRERFDYPPLTILIKISRSGQPKIVKEEMEKLRSRFENYDAETYPASTGNRKGQHTEHLLIKINRKRWIDEELWKVIKSLPQQFVVEVEPESVM